jgi:hypothetical protein
MAKVTPIRITEQFEHFVADLKDNFWGDVCGGARVLATLVGAGQLAAAR